MTPMKTAWPVPDVRQGFNPNLFGNLPVETTLWPDNDFNPPQTIRNYRALDPAAKEKITPSGSMSGIDGGVQRQGSGLIALKAAAPVAYQFEKTNYNRFSFGVDVAEAFDLLLKLTYDPNWRIKVNGKRVRPTLVNNWMTAIAVPKGHSEVRLDFEPFSRRLYLPLRYLTYLTSLLLVIGAILAPRHRGGGEGQAADL